MTDLRTVDTVDAYGVPVEPATLRIQRLLPGPAERVWDYLTRSELRRQWLAAGEMQAQAGTPFELVWRNSELTDPPGERPAGFGEEHRMQSRVLAFEPPRCLVIAWGSGGEVCFDLAPQGREVLLTVTHRRLPDRATSLNVAAGWHAHLDILAARLTGRAPQPYWDSWSRLKQDYDRCLPA